MRLALAAALVHAVAMTAPAQPSAPRVRLVEELRLDATAEDFPTVGRVHVSPRGEIVVPISADQQLLIYDFTGRKIATVGRRGSGPGEFQFIGLAGWLHDTMWVADRRQRRTTFISPQHEVLRTETFPQGEKLAGTETLVGYFDPLGYLADGSILGQALVPLTSAPGLGGRMKAIMALRAPGGGLREVLEARWSQEQPHMMNVAGLGRIIPFALQPQYAFSRDGQHVAELTAPIPARQESTFEVRLFGARGDTLFARSYPFRGVPIPKEAVDSALKSQLPESGRPTEGPPDLGQRFQALARERMSPWYIPVQTILLGLDGTIWIGMRVTDEGRGYLILNDSGDAIGSLMVPTSTRVRQASATRIWVTETDDDGLSSVVRYGITGLSCGPRGC